jgi:hypothetical protein
MRITLQTVMSQLLVEMARRMDEWRQLVALEKIFRIAHDLTEDH